MRPYFETENGKLYHGDCLEIMKHIPDNSIDMVLCDPPYGSTQCAWDVIIPFEPLWVQYKRIVTDGSAIVLTGSQPFTAIMIMSNPKWFKYCWVFKKNLPVGHGYAKLRPMSNHEDIAVFGRGAIKYNPQFTPRVAPRKYTRKGASLSGSSSMTSHDGKMRILNGKYPVTVQEFDTSNQRDKVHPTQKPIELFRYLIKTYTNTGDVVLDNCIGSGTTAIAAETAGRKWIGIEMSERYCELTKKRIKAETRQLQLSIT